MAWSPRGASVRPGRPPARPKPHAGYSVRSSRRGATVVEYVVLMVLIAAVVIVTTLVLWHQTRPSCAESDVAVGAGTSVPC